jgi:hypothetical protein
MVGRLIATQVGLAVLTIRQSSDEKWPNARFIYHAAADRGNYIFVKRFQD